MKIKFKLTKFITGLQFVWIVAFLALGPRGKEDPVLLAIWLVAALVGGWAVVAMRKQLKITPEPQKGGKLVVSGPYRWLRHPMYFSLLLFIGSILVRHFSIARLAIFGLLIVTLLIKTHLEEKLLAAEFTQYAAYKQKTWRFFPFLF